MNLPQSKGTSIKHTAIGTMKGQSKGQSSRSSPSKRQREASSSVYPQPKRPQSTTSNVATHTPLFRNSLQKKRYEMLQGTKYSCGRQILWNVFAFANFYTELHAYFVKMSWMGLANLSENSSILCLWMSSILDCLCMLMSMRTLCTLNLKIYIPSLMVKNELS